MSTGDRTILGGLSKRGNGYLRMLFMQAAGSFCCGRRTGRSTVLAPGSLVPLNAYILTSWLRPSPTSWHGSPGPCWHKSAAMRRASQRQQPEMNMLRFTKGMATAPCRPRRSPDLASERRLLRGDGSSSSQGQSWLSRRGLRVGMRRWRKGLASAFVIRWPIWPSGPSRE